MKERNMNKFDIILSKVQDIVTLTVDDKDIRGDTNLVEIGMDSIAFITLIGELEDCFGVEFPEDKLVIENSSTISKIIETLDFLGV